MEVKEITEGVDMQKAAAVMLELRPQYDLVELTQKMTEQRKTGYRVFAVQSGEDIICVTGFWLGEKLAWGKHIYIDDLVTAEKHRSLGAGKVLLDYIITLAKEQSCDSVHLDSGVQRFSAHRFYLKNNFKIASHHFSISLNSE